MLALIAGLLMLASACSHDERPTDPYVVAVDVGPQIRAFGEETLTADEAVEHLALLGPAVIPALAAALEREPRDGRLKAVEVLATIGSPDGVPALVRAAQRDEDVEVRGDALRALGTIGDPGGVAVVEDALSDVRLAVRAGAVTACAGLCTRPATIARLATIAIRDPDVSVALAARGSLAGLRARDADTDAAVRAAIGGRATDLATPDQRALAALLDSDLAPEATVEALVSALAAASPPLQRQLAFRLATIGDARAVTPVAALLESPDAMVRLYACDALMRMRDRGIAAAGPALATYAGQRPASPLAAPEY